MAVVWRAKAGQARCYEGLSIVTGTRDGLLLDQSIVVLDGYVEGIYPSDGLPSSVRKLPGLEIVDGSGATAVPGLVDCHAHLPLLGGARWHEHAHDTTERLTEVSARNAAALTGAGIRWIRDVGSPVRSDAESRTRAISLTLRDRWRNRWDVPYIRAAGTWLSARGTLKPGMTFEVDSADELLAAALQQLDDGADLVKLYLDGPDSQSPPWTNDELSRVVRAVRGRGKPVAAHATRACNVRAAAEAAVDTIEHGTEIEPSVARMMADAGVALVSTLSVYRSFITFSRTTTLPRFASEKEQRDLYGMALASVATAQDAGVRIVAGSDFGGGSVRPGHLAWEVESLVEAGLEPWDALAAATWRGGEVLGVPGAGRLVVGGLADFVLVHGDPTSDPSALWRLWEVVVADPGVGPGPGPRR